MYLIGLRDLRVLDLAEVFGAVEAIEVPLLLFDLGYYGLLVLVGWLRSSGIFNLLVVEYMVKKCQGACVDH